MKSKIMFLCVMFFGTFLSAQAEPAINNVYVNQPGITYYNGSYMMGTVSIPSMNNNLNNNQIPQTNVLNPQIMIPSQINSTCPAFITSYNKFGDLNQDVAKLQNFLNEYNGANLNGLGYFGAATLQEVKNFQYAYGINPTGSQYVKTTELINAIKCGKVMLKKRVIYSGEYVSQIYTKGMINKNIPTENIYPNPDSSLDINPEPTVVPTKTITKPITKGTTTAPKAPETDKAYSLSDDFQAIKDNYKAYILVFVLVLALFWFLRKAATE